MSRRRCSHASEVYVESSCGTRAFLCRDCGAADAGLGFGVSLAEDLAARERKGRPYPDGAFFTILEPPPSVAPGDECAGYRLKGPRAILSGSPSRPFRFAQRLDLPGRPWGRFFLGLDDKTWSFAGAFKTKAEASS